MNQPHENFLCTPLTAGVFEKNAWIKMATGWDKTWGGKPDETSCSKTQRHSVQTVPELAPGTYRQWSQTTHWSRGGEGQHKDAQVLRCQKASRRV